MRHEENKSMVAYFVGNLRLPRQLAHILQYQPIAAVLKPDDICISNRKGKGPSPNIVANIVLLEQN